MAIHRRKDKGEGRTVNARGKVVSSGAAAAQEFDDDTVGQLSLGTDAYAGESPTVIDSYTEYGTFYVNTEPFELEHDGRHYLVEQVTGLTNQYGSQYSAVGAEIDEDGQPSTLLRYLPGAALPENVSDAVSDLFPDAPPLPSQALPEPSIASASVEDGRIVVPVEPFEAYNGHEKVTVTKFVGGVDTNGHVMRAVFTDPLIGGEEYLKSERTPASVISAARELFRDEERDAPSAFAQYRAISRERDAERRRRDDEFNARVRQEKDARNAGGIEIDTDPSEAMRARRLESPSQMTRDIEAQIDQMEASGTDPQWIAHLREENEAEDSVRREQIAQRDARARANIGANMGAFPTAPRSEPDIDLNW